MMRKRRWPWVLLAVLGALAAAAAIALSLPPFGGRLVGERLVRAQVDPKYRDGAFVNPQPPAPYTWDYLRQIITGQFAGDEVRMPPAPLPALRPALAATPAPGLRAFWIGHASVYIEIDGLRLLVDPVFSDYASPFAFGPRRFQPPPVALAELPPIDAVLITHDHYDHLDMAHGAGAGAARHALLRAAGHRRAPRSLGRARRAAIASWSGGRRTRCAACASSPRPHATIRAADSAIATRPCGPRGR